VLASAGWRERPAGGSEALRNLEGKGLLVLNWAREGDIEHVQVQERV